MRQPLPAPVAAPPTGALLAPALEAGDAGARRSFDVFLSYSRRDRAFAAALEKALERYRPPRGLAVPRRHLEVFRDENDFTGVAYHESVARHLQESRKLVVLCSPAARASRYVGEEVDGFVASRSADDVVPVLVAGVPNNEAAAGQEAEMAFPEALCRAMRMPLAADFRGFDPARDRPGKGAFHGAWYTLLANLLGVGRSELERRDQRHIARRRALAVGVTGAVVAVLSIALVVTLLAKREAEHRRFVSLSQSLASQAAYERAQGEDDRAALLARQAFLFDRRHGGEVLSQVDAALRTALAVAPLALASRGDGNVYSLALAADGAKLAAGGEGEVRLWRPAESASPPAVLEGHELEVSALAFFPDGRTLASGSWDRTARLWDLAAPGEQPRVLRGHDDYVLALAFSPDGETLASGGADARLLLWDPNEEAEPRELVGSRPGVRCLAFSADGAKLAVGGNGGHLELWDLAAVAAPPRTLAGIAEDVRSLAFAPGGGTLAVAAGREVTLFDLERPAAPPRRLGGFEGDVTAVAFSPDSTALAVGELGPALRLLALANLDAAPAVLDTGAEDVAALAWGPGGLLASAGYRGAIWLWQARTAALADEVCARTRRNLAPDEWRRLVAADLPYERTCDNRPLHPAFIIEGEQLARAGDVAAAVAVFRRATELDPEQVFDDPQGYATRLSAEGLVVEGGRRAAAGDVEGAAAAFRRALEKDPARVLDPEAEARKRAAAALLASGRQRAVQGRLEEALSLLARAAELDPGLGVDPEGEAKPAVARSLVRRGERLAWLGRIEEAVAAFDEARQLHPPLAIGEESWNVLCWNGGLWGRPAAVAEACDRAVGDGDFESAGAFDSRGVVRALLGDRAGALEDFREFVDLADYVGVADDVVAERRGWITALEAGGDPITPEVVAALRRQ